MSTQIERVRFFDGEYLRGFDFVAEQTYHLEMRRRLNMGLHLYGIVEGLEIQSNTQSGITQSWISPGMAVDGYGREILVFATQVLDLSDPALQSNRANPPGSYSVWLRYKRVPSTPPSVGYAGCNQTGVTTRWQETYDVMLLSLATLPDATEQHQPNEGLSEDAKDDGVAVYLGTVDVDADGTFSIPTGKQGTADATTGAVPEIDPNRVYAGVRAQRIVPPIDAGKNLAILSKNTPQNPPTSVEVDANLFVTENLIVGDDFSITGASITPQPNGNVKVTGDLYLNGTLYNQQAIQQTLQWTTLDQYIANAISGFIPDVQTGALSLTIGSPPKPLTPPPNSAVGSQQFPISTSVQKVKSASVSVALADVQFDTVDNVKAILNNPQNKAGALLVQVAGNLMLGASPGQYNLNVTWAVGPTIPDTSDAAKVRVPVVTLQVAYVIVFVPQT